VASFSRGRGCSSFGPSSPENIVYGNFDFAPASLVTNVTLIAEIVQVSHAIRRLFDTCTKLTSCESTVWCGSLSEAVVDARQMRIAISLPSTSRFVQ